MTSFYQRMALCSLLILCMLFSAVPNLLPAQLAQQLPGWYTENTLSLGLDLQGGSHLLLQVDKAAMNLPDQHEITDDLMESTLEVVRRRLDETGLVEPSITRQGREYILVQMPGVADPAEVRELLGTTAKNDLPLGCRRK
ncbi:MAG: hypothetical protein LRY63_13260 [Nitrincola sp.]|nr:hypothetical protein [Nitrincola sp.]